MTVYDLIQKLKLLPAGRLVVLSRDAEGNGYEELADIQLAAFHDGEIGLECLTKELRAQGYTDEDVFTDGEPAVVLFP